MYQKWYEAPLKYCSPNQVNPSKKLKAFSFLDGLTWLGEQYFNGASYHFWYIYMIIGIYLFIPIIGRWIRSAPESHIQYFLGIWGLTILFNNPHFPYLKLPVA